jgi:putative MATE family efflux protein
MKKRLKELSALTLPVVVEQVFIVLMGMINTALIAALGTVALSAAGHVNSASMILIALFAALTTGGTIVVARYIGAKDETKAAAAGAQAILLAVIFSLFLTALLLIFRTPIINGLFGASEPEMLHDGLIYYGYIAASFPLLGIAQTLFAVMRGCGDTANPMKISLVMNIINFILSYVLIIGLHIPLGRFVIFTPSLGMHGAGLAMTLARGAGLLMASYIILYKNMRIRLRMKSIFSFNWKTQKDILRLGVPAGVESTLFHVGRLITQLFIVSFGTAAMAANTVAGTIFGLVMVPGNALAITTTVLIGQKVGRRETDDIFAATMFAVAVCMGIMAVIALVLLPLTNTLGWIYRLDGQALTYFKHLQWSSYIMLPLLWPLSFTSPSSLRAAGDVTFTMVVSVASMWLGRIVLGYLLGVYLEMGVLGVWLGMYADWIIRSLFFFFRLKSGAFLKKINVLE